MFTRKEMIRVMLKVTAVAAALVLGLGADPAQADQLLWARKGIGGLSTISIAQDGFLFCTGCDPDNYGPIPISEALV
jgi:hypothetical protein